MTYAEFLAFRRSLPRTPHLVSQRVRARGIDFAVFTSPPVAGEIPLVAINGGMIHDHSLLWPALSPLAAKRQLILFDLRGRGASSTPADPMAATIDDDAADAGALRRALGIRRWDVLGHSIGGGIAMLAAADDAAGVRNLILVDSVGPTSGWIEPLRHAVAERLTGDEREGVTKFSDADFLSTDPAVQSAYSRAAYPAWFADHDMAIRFASPEAMSQTGAAALARLRNQGYDWRPRLGGVSAPALVIHGEKDVLPAAVAFEIARSLQHARVAIVPSAGHMPFWEAPEPFFSLIETFIPRPTPGV
jgi:proline iminopeptidase